MSAIVSAISTVVPCNALDFESMISLYGEKQVNKIVRATGIERICIADDNTTTADLCLAAAKNIFTKKNISPADIDGLVFVTETPDYIIPHTSAILQDRLGLSKATIAFDINYGCAGYVYGLFQASMLIETGFCKNVLLLVGDTESKYIHEQDHATRMVIGDAGSATLLTDGQGAKSTFSFFTDGSRADSIMIPAGGCRYPRMPSITDNVELDSSGNGRTQENLYMDGMGVLQFALHDVPPVMENVLKQLGITWNDIDLVALHQANKFIVEGIAKQIHVDKTKVPFGVQKIGNTSGASIPTMLCNLHPGVNETFKRVMVCGYGTGLSCAAGVINFSRADILSIDILANK